jgi:peptidoglycan/LPS O-acetylase OafA/YrhL
MGSEGQTDSSKMGFAHVLRGLAALSVAIAHCVSAFWAARTLSLAVNLPPIPDTIPDPPISQLINHVPFHVWGASGVASFFVISGFVIPFTLERRSSAAFVVARVMRLWPTLIVAMLVAAGAIAFGSWLEDRPLPFTALDVLANMTLLGNYFGAPRLDGVLWTLEIEAKFYLMIALAAGIIMSAQIKKLMLLGLALAAVAASATFAIWILPPTGGYFVLFLRLLCNDSQMLAYMLIGVVFNCYHRGLVGVPQAAAAIAGLVVLDAVLWTVVPHGGPQWYYFLFCYAGAVLIFALCFKMRRFFSMHGPLAWLADISYPLYLGHCTLGYVLMNLLVRHGGVSPTLSLVLAFSVIIPLAIVVHRFVESPSQAIGRRLATLLDTRRGAAPIGAALQSSSQQ